MLSIPIHPNQENLFPTPIWGFIFNDHKYESLDYKEYIINLAKNTSSVKKSNQNGWQSEDNLHTHGIFREFASKVLSCATIILEPYINQKLELQSMWANINTTNSFNWQHTHEGILSGVFYLKVPKNSGRLIIVDPVVRRYNSPIRLSNYPITPEELACILFPGYLEHYVEPNLSNEERISVSFNIGVL